MERNIFYLSLLSFSRSVVSDSLRPHGLQHARLPRPSLYSIAIQDWEALLGILALARMCAALRVRREAQAPGELTRPAFCAKLQAERLWNKGSHLGLRRCSWPPSLPFLPGCSETLGTLSSGSAPPGHPSSALAPLFSQGDGGGPAGKGLPGT